MKNEIIKTTCATAVGFAWEHNWEEFFETETGESGVTRGVS